MDLFARVRPRVQVVVSPESVEFRLTHRSLGVPPGRFHWAPTVCLDPKSRKLYDVGKDACVEPDGVFIRLFETPRASDSQELRSISLQRFLGVGILSACETVLLRPRVEVTGITTFERRDRDRLREMLVKALVPPIVKVKSVTFLD